MVSELTYNVSSGTLNNTIPYHTVAGRASGIKILWGVRLGLLLLSSCVAAAVRGVSKRGPATNQGPHDHQIQS